MRAVMAVVLVTSAFLLSSCVGMTIDGDGDMKIEARDADGFDEVDVCCGMRLVITQGSDYSLEIEADESALPKIRSEVKDGKLVVDIEDFPLGLVTINGPILVYVTAPEFTAISSSGGGRIEADALDAQRLTIGVSGGGRAAVADLTADSLVVNVSGGSQAELAGQVDSQVLESSGGSKYSAGDLQSAEARVNLSGGGRASVWVTDALDVSASGGSRLEYYGEAAVTSDSSGGSDVKSLGAR